MENLIIDSTIVRAHPCAAGASKKKRPSLSGAGPKPGHGAGADHGIPAQNRRVRVDRDVILDRGMALAVLVGAALAIREGSERDAVVELDPVADHGGLADHDSGAVVDEEMAADLGTGVDVDSGAAVCLLRHDPRSHVLAELIEGMRDAVGRDGEDVWGLRWVDKHTER